MTTPPTSEVRGKFHDRHAWMLIFLMGFLLAIFGASYIGFGVVNPASYSPHMALLTRGPEELTRSVGQLLRSWGIFEGIFGVLIMILTFVPYRRCERWAWFTLWTVPLALVGELLNALAVGDPAGPLYVFPLIPILGLVLPVRQFFPARHRQLT